MFRPKQSIDLFEKSCALVFRILLVLAIILLLLGEAFEDSGAAFGLLALAIFFLEVLYTSYRKGSIISLLKRDGRWLYFRQREPFSYWLCMSLALLSCLVCFYGFLRYLGLFG